MKTALIIMLVVPVLSFKIYSQHSILEKKIRIEEREGTTGEILDELANRGGFVFSYNQDINRNEYIVLKNQKQTVQQFLNAIFNDRIYYVEYGNKLILIKKPSIPEIFTLRGRVVDIETKESIPGVTIIVPGTQPLIGTVTDENGYFDIELPTDISKLRLSCIGYGDSLIFTGGNKSLSIGLNQDRHEIDEVELVYYTRPKKEKLNSAISKIKAIQIESLPGESVENLLQGNASGVHVVRNSGMPGASLQVSIRGKNSLINSDPVYYLDGVYIQNAMVNTISPGDIEEIQILKDASSTASYGAIAGNGVVLLKSKQPDNNGLTINLDYYFGLQEIWKNPDLMTLSEFKDYYQLIRPWGTKYDTLSAIYERNWIDDLFHRATTQNVHFSIRSRGKRSEFYVSSGYFNQLAIIKKLELNRYSFKINSKHSINKRFNLGQDLTFSYMQLKGLKEGCFLNDFNNPILGALCMFPANDSVQSLLGINTSDQGITFTHPYDDLELSHNRRDIYSLNLNLNAGVELIPDLKYSTTLGLGIFFQDNASYSRYKVIAATDINDITFGNTYNIIDLSMIWLNSIAYNKVIYDDHQINVSIGFELGQENNEWIPINRYAYDSTWNSIYNPDLVETDKYTDCRTNLKFSHFSWTGSADYNFKNRYVLNLALRRETVGFYYDRKLNSFTDYYPSFSAGWTFSEENFFPVTFFNYGKIRVGWGRAGISPRINYSFFAKMMREMEYVYGFNDDGQSTITALQRRTNEQYYHEFISSRNIGLDLGFFRNKLFVSADYFVNDVYGGRKRPIDKPKSFIQILNSMHHFGIHELPVSEMVNTGYDLELRYKYNSRKIQCETGINISRLNNKVISIEQSVLSNQQSTSSIDLLSVYLPGEVAGSFYGYKIERLFKIEDCDEKGIVVNQPYHYDDDGNKVYAQPGIHAGDYKYADINGDGDINREDRVILGNPLPDFSFGLFYSMDIFRFDFSILFQGTYGNEIFNATKLWLYNPYGVSNWTRDIVRSYRKPQSSGVNDPGVTITDLHRVDYYGTNKNLRVSDFYVEDGSYLRLRNIMLGYTLSSDISKKAYINKFRLFISAQNLFTWTNYSGLDPEVGGWGIDCGIYPQPRTYIAGINLEF